MKKKLKSLFIIFSLIFAYVLPVEVKASGGYAKLSANETVEVGSTITVNATIGGDNLYMVLGSVSTSDSGILSGGGQLNRRDIEGFSSHSQSFTFTAHKTGTVTITLTVDNENTIDLDGNSLGISSDSITVTVVEKKTSSSTPSTPASTPSKPTTTTPVKTYNLNLSSIQVEGAELSPKFSSSTVDYEVELPKGTKTVKINASAADSKVSIQGIGTLDVVPGFNQFDITTHHSETSKTKTYRVNVYVEEEPSVFIDYKGEQLGVYPSFRGSETLKEFENTEVVIDNQTVLGKVNENGLVLLYMVNGNGEKAFYVYKDNMLTPYKPVTLQDRSFISQEIPEVLKEMKGLTQQVVILDKMEFNGWVFEDESMGNYVLVYLMNEKGESNIYQYEMTEKTLQLYSNMAAIKQEDVDALEDKLGMTQIFLYIFIGLSVLLIAFLVWLIVEIKKRKIK